MNNLVEVPEAENHRKDTKPNHREGRDGIILPMAPRGCRKISLRSRFSLRGHLVARLYEHDQHHRIGFESKLEWDFVAIALANREVIDLVEQPFCFEFKDSSGKSRRHTFDYLVTTDDGTKTAVAVKVAQKARQSNIQEDLSQIATQIPSELADQVSLFTDEHFEPWQAWNAHHLHECRKTVDHDADRRLSCALTGLKGAVTIEDLVQLLGLRGRGYRAIVRGIFDGSLKALSSGRFGSSTMVAIGAAQ